MAGIIIITAGLPAIAIEIYRIPIGKIGKSAGKGSNPIENFWFPIGMLKKTTGIPGILIGKSGIPVGNPRMIFIILWKSIEIEKEAIKNGRVSG